MSDRGSGSCAETHVIEVGGRHFTLERAKLQDVPALVSLLADDPLGAGRHVDDRQVYEAAFADIDHDPNQFLAVVRDPDGGLVGTMQVSLIPGLSRGAMTRVQIEAVRVAERARGVGLGSAMFAWAHEHGRRRGAGLAQLTTDNTRVEAHRFYARLGYQATHQGLKLPL
jgi:GNAT superfamily N-acetyltransferase